MDPTLGLCLLYAINTLDIMMVVRIHTFFVYTMIRELLFEVFPPGTKG